MGIKELRESVERRQQKELREAEQTAAERIKDLSVQTLETIKSLLPSMFIGGYPISRWVWVESNGSCCSVGSSLGAVLEDEIVLVLYRGHGCNRMALFRYKQGRSSVFAEPPREYRSQAISEMPSRNEKNLLELISLIE